VSIPTPAAVAAMPRKDRLTLIIDREVI